MRSIQVTGRQSDALKLTNSSAKNIIQKKVWIRASSEVVFGALTDSKELVRWFCDRAASTPREGGELVAFWSAGKSGRKGRAVFTRIVPNSALELLWIDDGEGADSRSSKHTLSYSIRSKAGMTEVVMVDKDESASDGEAYDFLDQGWNTVLLELKDHCERRERSDKIRSGSKPRSRDAT
jgi:uncharacterized protein YndB with AHSA1/START domain